MKTCDEHGRYFSNYLNGNFKHRCSKYTSQNTETIRVDKNVTQLYAVYEKPTLNVKTHMRGEKTGEERHTMLTLISGKQASLC